MSTSKRFLLTVTLTALGVALSVALSSDARQDKPVDPSKKVIAVLGDETTEVLRNATKVEAFRIKPEKSNDDSIKRIAGYPIIATGKEQGKDFTVRLTNVLFTDVTYQGQSARCFEPGVVFRAWTDKKESVEIIICYHCTNLYMRSRDANGKIIKEEIFAPFGGTPSWTVLVKLAKEAFPDDKAIQALKEEVK